MKTEITKDSDQALRVFQKLPARTKDLLILADSEEHAIGTQKLVLQKKIQQIVKPSKRRVRRLADVLLLSSLAWATFATELNFTIWRLNP